MMPDYTDLIARLRVEGQDEAADAIEFLLEAVEAASRPKTGDLDVNWPASDEEARA